MTRFKSFLLAGTTVSTLAAANMVFVTMPAIAGSTQLAQAQGQELDREKQGGERKPPAPQPQQEQQRPPRAPSPQTTPAPRQDSPPAARPQPVAPPQAQRPREEAPRQVEPRQVEPRQVQPLQAPPAEQRQQPAVQPPRQPSVESAPSRPAVQPNPRPELAPAPRQAAPTPPQPSSPAAPAAPRSPSEQPQPPLPSGAKPALPPGAKPVAPLQVAPSTQTPPAEQRAQPPRPPSAESAPSRPAVQPNGRPEPAPAPRQAAPMPPQPLSPAAPAAPRPPSEQPGPILPPGAKPVAPQVAPSTQAPPAEQRAQPPRQPSVESAPSRPAIQPNARPEPAPVQNSGAPTPPQPLSPAAPVAPRPPSEQPGPALPPGARPVVPPQAAPSTQPPSTQAPGGGPTIPSTPSVPNAQRPQGGLQAPAGQSAPIPAGATVVVPGQPRAGAVPGGPLPNPVPAQNQGGQRRNGGISPGAAIGIGVGAGLVGGFIAGSATQSYSDVQRSRRQVEGNGYTLYEEPGRSIIRENDRYYVQHDETQRFRDLGGPVQTYQQGNTLFTTAQRPNGDQVITITDLRGRLLRRERRQLDGRVVVLIDNTYAGPERSYEEDVIRLAAPSHSLPRDRYIVDADNVREDVIYETLIAPPVQALPRRYTLDEVRASPDVRAYMPSIDINTVNFETNSYLITADQAPRLAGIARALMQAIQKSPNEVYLIEGYTDAVGTPVDNLSLSDRRAQSVATLLTQSYNVPPENLSTQGFGEQYLKVQTQGPSQENRRVTVRRITPLLKAEPAR